MIGVDLGLCPYQTAWEYQKRLHQAVCDNPDQAYLLKVEHPTVLTLGKNATRANLLLSETQYRQEGIEIVDVDRGGEVTAHSPGQLVVYPILSVRRYTLSPRRYIEIIENAVIELLRDYGVDAFVDPERPGVWVGPSKICAVGVRIKNRVTMHGFALNVCNDLSVFKKIVPCGISNGLITSLRHEGHEANVNDVYKRFLKIWCERFGAIKFVSTIDDVLSCTPQERRS